MIGMETIGMEMMEMNELPGWSWPWGSGSRARR